MYTVAAALTSGVIVKDSICLSLNRGCEALRDCVRQRLSAGITFWELNVVAHDCKICHLRDIGRRIRNSGLSSAM